MKQSLKRLVSMLLAMAFLVAALLMFFNLVQPAYATMETLRGQLIGENQALASESKLVAQAKSLIASFGNGSQDQGNVALAVPQGQDVAGALAQLEGIAQNNSVTITTIGIGAPELNVAQTTITNATPTGSQSLTPLESFTLTLAGTASYENFKGFLGNLETNIRIFDLQSLSLAPTVVFAAPGTGGKGASSTTASSRDLFNYVLSMKTYYQSP